MKTTLRALPAPASELPALIAALRIHPRVADRRSGSSWTVQCNPHPGHDASVFDLQLTLYPAKAAVRVPEPASIVLTDERGAPCATGTPDARGVVWFRDLPAVPLRAVWKPQTATIVAGPSHGKLAALPPPPRAVDTGHRQFTAEVRPDDGARCVLVITSRTLPAARVRFCAAGQTVECGLENGSVNCLLECPAVDCDAGLEDFTVVGES